jgi:hypothetical protein
MGLWNLTSLSMVHSPRRLLSIVIITNEAQAWLSWRKSNDDHTEDDNDDDPEGVSSRQKEAVVVIIIAIIVAVERVAHGGRLFTSMMTTMTTTTTPGINAHLRYLSPILTSFVAFASITKSLA